MAASICRSVATISRRSIISSHPNAILTNLAPQSVLGSAFSSPARPFLRAASRFASVLGGVETMMPLHSAIAAARLKSNIAVDTACWSMLSQDFAIPR